MANKTRNRTVDYAVYLAVRLLVALMQMLSPRAAYAAADGFARLAYALVKGRRRAALENIRAAYPETADDPAAAERLARAMYRHFCQSLVDLVMAPRKLHVRNWRNHLVLSGGERILAHLLTDRPALIVTAHFGNWEMAGFHLGLCGFRTHAIARVLDNPYLHRYALHFRQRTGQTIINKNGDWKHLTDALGGGGKVATLADQDAGPGGVFVDFFGRPASTHKAVALLAMQYDAVMLVIGVPRVNRADYPQHPNLDPGAPLSPMFYAVNCTDVIDPRDYAARPDAVKAITARYTAALEQMVREYPDQYFWMHRRWKHQPRVKGAKVA